MICNKCNSIIPDEAKFCPSCGADCKPAAQTAPKANHCAKCGLELENSAKFCPVCGTAVSAVSLDKQPDSDSLVSAMPTSVPTPAAVTVPPAGTTAYAPPADAIPGGFGEPAPMPQYAPPADAAPGSFGSSAPAPQYAPPAGGFGDMGNMGTASSAAAAVAVPVKKKNGAKVAIIIAAAVVALLAATAIFFFTNKAAFLSTFMGKTKYAAMVEGNSIKETVGKIDTSAISTSVKSVSGFYGSFSANSSAKTIMPTMYGTSDIQSMDLATLIMAYNQVLTETYGTDAIKVTAGANINLSDSAMTAIGSKDVDKILDIINGTTFTYDLAASENAMGAQFGTEGKLTINARVLLTEDGSYYLAVPFASDKALMFKIDSDKAQTSAKTAVLELDEKEISRLIEEIIKIYLAHYEKAVTDMGSGSLTVDGAEVSGKLISAEFSGSTMSEMMKDIIKHIGEDEYFANKIVDFVKECGGDLTLAEYKDAFDDAADEIEIPDSAAFTVKTVINNNGDVLAKSYAINAEGKMELAYKGSEKDFAAEFIYEVDGDKCTVKFTNTENSLTGSYVMKSGDDTFTAEINCVKTDSKSGTATITFQENDDGEYKFDVSYNGIEKVKSFNRDVLAGTVSVTVNMPKNVNSLDNELLTVLDGMQITVSNTAAADSQTMNFTVKTTAYGDASFYATVTATDKGSILTVPKNVIDVSEAMTGSLDEDTQKQLTEFENEVMDAISKIDILSDSIPGFGTTIPGDDDDDNNDPWIVDFNNDSHANDDFNSMTAYELSELSTDYVIRFISVSEYADNNPELESKLYDAQDILNSMSNYMTAYNSESAHGTIDVYMLREWRKILKKFVIAVEECESLVTACGSATGASHANDDFSAMSFDEINDLFNEYISRRFDLTAHFGTVEFDSKLTVVNEAYSTAHDYWFDYCYVYNYNDAATLNALRNSVRDFVIAVEACEALID